MWWGLGWGVQNTIWKAQVIEKNQRQLQILSVITSTASVLIKKLLASKFNAWSWGPIDLHHPTDTEYAEKSLEGANNREESKTIKIIKCNYLNCVSFDQKIACV